MKDAVKIWHIAIPVRNLDTSVEFYRKALGFQVIGFDEYSTKKQAFIELGRGGFTLELFQPKQSDFVFRHPDHLAFECLDLRATREQILQNGLLNVDQVEDFENGLLYLSLTDPDDIKLELFQGREIYENSIRERAGSNNA